MTFEAITNIAQAETEAKEMISTAESNARQIAAKVNIFFITEVFCL